jgi:hypothetical protein
MTLWGRGTIATVVVSFSTFQSLGNLDKYNQRNEI